MSESANNLDGNHKIPQVLTELIASGKKLLQAQPMEREHYQRWSDTARQRLTECFGTKDPGVKEFFTSRREISTSFELDPSYYLTQIGANLRRELKVLEKFSRDQGPPAVPAAAGPPARKPSPQPAAAPKAAASRAAGKVLVLADKNAAAADFTIKTAAGLGCAAEILPADKRKSADSLWSALKASQPNWIIFFLDRGRNAEGKPDGWPVESALELGIAAGFLGPQKVLVIAGEKSSSPQNAGGLTWINAESNLAETLAKILKS